MTQKPGRPESEWSGRMKRIAVLGDTLAGGKIYGIQRFAFELLRQLDRMDLGGMEIELVIPEYAAAAEAAGSGTLFSGGRSVFRYMHSEGGLSRLT